MVDLYFTDLSSSVLSWYFSDTEAVEVEESGGEGSPDAQHPVARFSSPATGEEAGGQHAFAPDDDEEDDDEESDEAAGDTQTVRHQGDSDDPEGGSDDDSLPDLPETQPMLVDTSEASSSEDETAHERKCAVSAPLEKISQKKKGKKIKVIDCRSKDASKAKFAFHPRRYPNGTISEPIGNILRCSNSLHAVVTRKTPPPKGKSKANRPYVGATIGRFSIPDETTGEFTKHFGLDMTYKEAVVFNKHWPRFFAGMEKEHERLRKLEVESDTVGFTSVGDFDLE